MLRWGRIAAAYALLGLLAFAVAVVARGHSPFLHPSPWLDLAPAHRHAYSLISGVTFGALIVLSTRFAVGRFTWARRLHTTLRPFARSMTVPAIVAVAALSALGEELLFRGLLQPWLGLIPQALIFGIVHQIPGPSRWVWVAWATVVGLAFGALFQLTGSLAGPIAAHALVNGVNLFYLKTHDPEPRHTLGGLFRQQQPNP